MARGSFSSSPLDEGALPFRMPGTSRVTVAPPAGDLEATPALGAVAPVGGGRAVPGGGGGTVAGESSSLPKNPGHTPTTKARPPSGAGRTSTLAESQRGGVGVHPSALDGQGSARSGRRPSAHLAWRRLEAHRVPGLVGSPPAWDRSEQRTRCRRRKRSDSVRSYREFSGSPRKTWPGHSGSVPPGTTGHSTHCRRWVGQNPAYMGSSAQQPKGCRGRRPTRDTCATYPRYSETQRRRRLPRRRTGPQSGRVARPSPWLSPRPRGHLPRPRARARRHYRGPDRARLGGVRPRGASA